MATDPRLASDVFWPRLEAALAQVSDEARTPPPAARVGAVLVLLEQGDDGPVVVLTRRRRDMRSHPGQVSFAGGRLDPGESVEEAALREAREEIGLDPASVEVMGAGPTFYIPPSRFWVVPVVARWTRPHPLDTNPWEVDAVLRVPLAQLLEEGRWRHVPLSLRGSTWAWQLDDDLLWGATAVVVALLLEVSIEGWSGGRSPEDLPPDRAVHPWEDAPAWQRRTRLEGGLPEVEQDDVPHATIAQVREVLRRLAEAGLDWRSLAEQAGRGVAHAVRRLLGDSVDGARVTVLAGPAGNGAAGLVAARLLAAGGARVQAVRCGDPASTRQVPDPFDGHAGVLGLAGVPLLDAGAEGVPADVDAGDVVVDAMLGIGAEPPLRGVPAAANAWLRRHDVPVVALDLPSGLSADDGLRGTCVSADVTVTLGAPKVGLRPRVVHPYVGDLYLADIGIPAGLWQQAGVGAVAVFGRGPLVRLTTDQRASDAGTPDQGEVPTPQTGAPEGPVARAPDVAVDGRRST